MLQEGCNSSCPWLVELKFHSSLKNNASWQGIFNTAFLACKARAPCSMSYTKQKAMWWQQLSTSPSDSKLSTSWPTYSKKARCSLSELPNLSAICLSAIKGKCAINRLHVTGQYMDNTLLGSSLKAAEACCQRQALLEWGFVGQYRPANIGPFSFSTLAFALGVALALAFLFLPTGASPGCSA